MDATSFYESLERSSDFSLSEENNLLKELYNGKEFSDEDIKKIAIDTALTHLVAEHLMPTFDYVYRLDIDILAIRWVLALGVNLNSLFVPSSNFPTEVEVDCSCLEREKLNPDLEKIATLLVLTGSHDETGFYDGDAAKRKDEEVRLGLRNGKLSITAFNRLKSWYKGDEEYRSRLPLNETIYVQEDLELMYLGARLQEVLEREEASNN